MNLPVILVFGILFKVGKVAIDNTPTSANYFIFWTNYIRVFYRWRRGFLSGLCYSNSISDFDHLSLFLLLVTGRQWQIFMMNFRYILWRSKKCPQSLWAPASSAIFLYGWSNLDLWVLFLKNLLTLIWLLCLKLLLCLCMLRSGNENSLVDEAASV